MSNTQEFGIIEDINEKKYYIDYEPKKYNCVSIDDDFFTEIYIKNRRRFESSETFVNSLDRDYKGLFLC